MGRMKGFKQTEAVIQRLRRANTGRPLSAEHKQKLSLAHRGKTPWNKGIPQTAETREKLSNALRGRKIPLEVCVKLSVMRMGHATSEETRRKIGDAQRGDKANNWKGGITNLPYCVKFSQEFRERVRAFFGHTCVECGKSQTDNGASLDVHHVNFDKMTCCNDVEPLFVALCMSCHGKTQHNREYYEQHFEEVIMTKFEGKCYLPKPEGVN